VDILIATANPGKYREIVAVMTESPASADPCINWKWLGALAERPAEPHEDGATFAENAALKARYYSLASGLRALADDSGLEVDALRGEPGVHSAYYAGEFADRPRAERDAANNRKLITALRGVPPANRTARFRCCLALADGDRILATAEGTVEGVIIDEPRGTGGFGYDPHFFIPAIGRTTAELTREEKNRISHRGRALRAMRAEILRMSIGCGAFDGDPRG